RTHTLLPPPPSHTLAGIPEAPSLACVSGRIRRKHCERGGGWGQQHSCPSKGGNTSLGGRIQKYSPFITALHLSEAPTHTHTHTHKQTHAEMFTLLVRASGVACFREL